MAVAPRPSFPQSTRETLMLPAQPVEDRIEGRLSRRHFVRVCTMAGAAIGLSGSMSLKMAEAAASSAKPSVIWLHFQECTGCTESLLRTSHPELSELILDLISLDYHETLFVAAGHQAEAARKAAMERHKGKYVLVIEGAIPTKDNGVYCMIGGQTALAMARECAEHAGAIIAIGSCASWGGVQSADPNPTGAQGAPAVLEGKTVVSLPGCPANPYILLGTVLQYATFGTLPALDAQGRPTFAYGRTIHEHCPRRAHFDAGRFASEFGDEGHRLGYCLYKLGCKGPATHASCSTLHFNDLPDAWPIGLGAPCFGCTEQKLGFRVPLHDTVAIERPTPPDTYPSVQEQGGVVAPLAAGLVGVAAGALATFGWMNSKKMDEKDAATASGSAGRKE